MLIQHRTHAPQHQPLKKSPEPPPDSPGPGISYADWRALDGPVLKGFTTLTSSLVGAGNGLGSAVVGACAGGAHGVVHGAQLDPRCGNLLMGAHLAAIGAATANYGAIQPLGAGLKTALGIAMGGAGSSLRLGFSEWSQFPAKTQAELFAITEKWTDQLRPPQEHATGQYLLARGTAGEVAGVAAGGLVGFRHGLQQGRDLAQQWIDSVQQKIYENMHSSSSEDR